ncbi:MAG TPA: transcriptional regulator NrdR [Candidatus Saccharimonadales bacterium]|nr:transcriptional regulator NrdR [Candidatus Saccharimonadales bacterium]
MKCPQCQENNSKVIESRDVASGESTRRRRECLACQYRYTTYERMERPNLTVIKKTGVRQLFDREKLVAGLARACEKTTITAGAFEELVARIEHALFDRNENEITSEQIGEVIMDELADCNQVAYVRFASVYRSFTDLDSFERELARIRGRLNKV